MAVHWSATYDRQVRNPIQSAHPQEVGAREYWALATVSNPANGGGGDFYWMFLLPPASYITGVLVRHDGWQNTESFTLDVGIDGDHNALVADHDIDNAGAVVRVPATFKRTGGSGRVLCHVKAQGNQVSYTGRKITLGVRYVLGA